MDMHCVIGIVVTYNPGDISNLLTSLTNQCADVVVVDNGSRNSDFVQESCTEAQVAFVGLGENLGIAAAQNIGISWARERGATHALLMDHDSVPAENMVELLLDALNTDSELGAVGPLAIDEREGADALVYVDRGWKPGRTSAEEIQNGYVDVPFLIASGCLIRVSALDDIGVMNESLFIDHVDLEWGLRARSAGWALAVIPQAILHHSLGDETVAVKGRGRPVHVHSPIRNYYLVRNTLWLIRDNDFTPARWRAYYAWWTAKYTAFNVLFLPFFTDGEHAQKNQRWRMFRDGVTDGFRRRMGRKS